VENYPLPLLPYFMMAELTVATKRTAVRIAAASIIVSIFISFTSHVYNI